MVLILLVVVLALRNAQTVQLDLWFWQVETSFSLVMRIAVTFSALTSFLLSLPDRLNKGKQIREKNEKIEFLEKEIIQLGKKTENPPPESALGPKNKNND